MLLLASFMLGFFFGGTPGLVGCQGFRKCFFFLPRRAPLREGFAWFLSSIQFDGLFFE